jgi:hypothetical protein
VAMFIVDWRLNLLNELIWIERLRCNAFGP